MSHGDLIERTAHMKTEMIFRFRCDRRITAAWLLSLTILVLAGVACRNPQLSGDPLEKVLTREFEAAVGPASAECAANLQTASAQLVADVDSGFSELALEFGNLCLSSDGYLERTKGTEEAEAKLTDYLRVAVTDLLNHSLTTFSERYASEVELLETRLLVKTGLQKALLELRKREEFLVAEQPAALDVDQIRGSGAWKVADEAAGWIPIAGDAYELAKLALGDPREKAIKERAAGHVAQIRDHWLQQITEIAGSLPKEGDVQRTCRERFNARLAIKLLETK